MPEKYFSGLLNWCVTLSVCVRVDVCVCVHGLWMIVEETERSSKETSWRWDAVAPKAMRAARQKRKKRRMSCDKDYKKNGEKGRGIPQASQGKKKGENEMGQEGG